MVPFLQEVTMNLDEERIRELQRKDQEHDARLDMQKE